MATLAVPSALALDAGGFEPINLRIRSLDADPNGTRSSPIRRSQIRLLHFTDLHYKGDRSYTQKVVDSINAAAPDFVCFSGDLVEDRKWFSEALSYIEKIKVPVYGSPGNHDYHCGAPFSEYQRVFSGTGGRWLADDAIVLPQYNLELVGLGTDGVPVLKPPQAPTRFLLTHFPKSVEDLKGKHYFDWIMAGHSHGGQVRIPGYGAPILPLGVGPYDLGYYETEAGPLYVNPGIGWYKLPFRFNCRPELTIVRI